MVDQVADELISRLHTNPGDGEAYEHLKAHYRGQGDWASLANLLEGWAGNNTGSPAAASAALLEAGDAALRAADDRPRAHALYHQSLQLDVTNRTAGERLVALLEEERAVQALAEFLDGYLRALEGNGDPAYLAQLYLKLGALWEHE